MTIFLGGGRSTPNSVSSKGGSGTFRNGAPPAYSNTRSTYNNYPPAYSGGYSSTSRYGYSGFYNPALMYFAIMPPFLFLGYHSAYHRYNQNDGYYYAPQLTYGGSNTQNAIINGTVNSGKNDNYRFNFNLINNNQFPIIDHAFYSSSDPNAKPADFVYRTQFSEIVEFDDLNQNGFYDANEPILSVTSLQNLQWQNFIVTNITVPNNATQSYIQTTTFANVTYNNTAPGGNTGGPSFGIRINYRSSNLQLNNTAPIVMQPNSLQYDFNVEGFPNSAASTHPNARLAIAQVLSTRANTPINFDVNMTTPVDVANQIKTNQTYGISVGDYTQGRLEFQNSVNISDVSTVSTWTTIDAVGLASAPSYDQNDWVWGPNAAPNGRVNKLLFVTVPGYSNSTGPINAGYSAFGFLDVDVMNALANGEDPNAAGSLHNGGKLLSVLLATSAAVYFLV
ncbi:unnamed protein product [Mucor hiemalis]